MARELYCSHHKLRSPNGFTPPCPDEPSRYTPGHGEESTTNVLMSDYPAVTTTPAAAKAEFLRLELSEMHDHLIASEAIARKITLVSGEPVFKTVSRLKLIWK